MTTKTKQTEFVKCRICGNRHEIDISRGYMPEYDICSEACYEQQQDFKRKTMRNYGGDYPEL